MIRLLATGSADPRFKNIHSLGFGSYIARTREILCGAAQRATVISPWIDDDGIRFLLECWDARESAEVEWHFYVRQANRALTLAAKEKAWRVFEYQRPNVTGEPPYGMHAKVVIGDEAASTVGSMNLLKASLYSNLEVGMDIRDRVMSHRLARVAGLLERVSTEVRV